MKQIDISKFSAKYALRKLCADDVTMIYEFCKSNVQYYQYCGKDISAKLIESDLTALPPDIPIEQKYYVGFFDGEMLVAIMDIIDGYPDEKCAFIGFFMMNSGMQGEGIGSSIISGVLSHLQSLGFERCRLGIDKENPQSNHFWRKCGFEIVSEVKGILVAQKNLK